MLRDILEIQTEVHDMVDMQSYILENFGGKIDVHGNIYITKGKSDVYPCIVSHMDTVHDIIDGYKVFELDGNYIAYDTINMLPCGIGGDDKVGIHIALECLKHFDNIKVAFFVDEEIGCVGSSKANMDFFNDVGYIVQCDRKGYADVVTNIMNEDICSHDFINKIDGVMHAYGKKECKAGGLTDVYQLRQNGFENSVINLSCGYYYPHSENEYVSIKDVNDTLLFTIDIVKKLGQKIYKHNSTYYDYFNSWNNYETCSICNSYEVIHDTLSDENYCLECQEYTQVL